MLTIIKKNKVLYNLLLKVHRKISFIKRYVTADRIVGEKFVDDGDRYLLLRYKNSASGLMTMMLNALGWIHFAESKNYKLLIDIKNDFACYGGKAKTGWNDFFLQPMVKNNFEEKDIEEMIADGRCMVCPNGNTRFNLRFYDTFYRKLSVFIKPKIMFPQPRDYKNNIELHREYSNLYKKYIHFNPKVMNYLLEEYESILKDKGKILGIIARGTDYVQLKPSLHPIQPSIDEIISKAKELRTDYFWEYIYLATEEKAIVERFEEAFPGKILINKRSYYDGDYSNKYLCEVKNEREDDEYLRNLEYLSSMNLLANCHMLIGGMCGGSQAVLIMRGDKPYEYLYLFDFGDYK